MKLQLKKTYILVGIIVLLFCLTIVFGLLYIRNSQTKTSNQLPQGKTQTPSTQKQTFTPENILKIRITKEMSKEELEQYGKLLHETAQDTDIVKIQSCKSSPNVIRVKQNTPITFINADADDHVLKISGTQDITELTLPSKNSDTFIPVLNETAVTYSYTCDSSADLTGIIVVTE